jgi:hypothetical protein
MSTTAIVPTTSVWSVIFRRKKSIADFYKDKFKGVTDLEFKKDYLDFTFWIYEILTKKFLSPIGFLFDAFVLGLIIFSYIASWDVFNIYTSAGISSLIGILGGLGIQVFIHKAGSRFLTDLIGRSWWYSFRYFIMTLLTGLMFIGGIKATLYLTNVGLPASGGEVLEYLNPLEDFDDNEKEIQKRYNSETNRFVVARDNEIELAVGDKIDQLEANEGEITTISNKKTRLTKEYNSWLKNGKSAATFNWTNRIFIGVVQQRACTADVKTASLRKANTALRKEINDAKHTINAKYQEDIDGSETRKKEKLEDNDADEDKDEDVRAAMIGIAVDSNIGINLIAAFLLFLERFFIVAGATPAKYENLLDGDKKWSPNGIFKYIFGFQWILGRYTLLTAIYNIYRKSEIFVSEVNKKEINEAKQFKAESKSKLAEKQTEIDQLKAESVARVKAKRLDAEVAARKEAEAAISLENTAPTLPQKESSTNLAARLRNLAEKAARLKQETAKADKALIETENIEAETENLENEDETLENETLEQFQESDRGEGKLPFEDKTETFPEREDLAAEPENMFEWDLEKPVSSETEKSKKTVSDETGASKGFPSPETGKQKKRVSLKILSNKLEDANRVGDEMDALSNNLGLRRKIYIRSDGSINKKDYRSLAQKGYNLRRPLLSNDKERVRTAKVQLSELIELFSCLGYKTIYNDEVFSIKDKYGKPSLGLEFDPIFFGTYIQASDKLQIEEV